MQRQNGQFLYSENYHLSFGLYLSQWTTLIRHFCIHRNKTKILCHMTYSLNTATYAQFPPFRCSSSVAVSPFCRCKIPLFCKNYVRKYRSVTAVNSKKIRNGSGNGNGNGNGVRKRQRLTGTAKRQQKNATEWWKPGITLPYCRTAFTDYWTIYRILQLIVFML